ncbi:hypothetical protein [Terasakiella pusilla]|uniref:hypothetical protein n=1 Tax=Terasakiella pusilla TaxID=64973 RepID=UPI003AA96F4F
MTRTQEVQEQLERKLDELSLQIFHLQTKARIEHARVQYEIEQEMDDLRKQRDETRSRLDKLKASERDRDQVNRTGEVTSFPSMENAVKRTFTRFG